MRVLNYGSLNLDYVYQVPHILQGGETLAALQNMRHLFRRKGTQPVDCSGARRGMRISCRLYRGGRHCDA